MKVAMFSRFPVDINASRGGVESATIGLLRGLMSHGGIDLHVVTMEKACRELTVEQQEGITIHRLPGSPVPMFIDILAGPGKKRLRSYLLGLQPDIIHFQETYGLGMWDIEKPSVFTVHGFDSLNLVTEKPHLWRLRSVLWKYVEKLGLTHQKNLISINPYVKQEIEKYNTGNVYEIANAISVKYFECESNKVKGRVFFAGWLNPRKNVISLLRAIPHIIKSSPDISVHIAGEKCDDEYFEDIQSTIKNLHIDKYVNLLGRINQDEVMRELSEASVFVLPSKQENAPMAIAEAMAMGVPVISSNLCGMPYMIKHEETGFLIEPDDHEDIARRIIYLFNNDDDYAKISGVAIKDATENYHPVSVAKKTIQAYEEIIAQ